MKLIQEQTLSAYMKSQPLSAADAMKIMRQIAERVSAMHRAGKLFSNLNPANVRLMRDGQGNLQAEIIAASISQPDLQDATEVQTMSGGALIDNVRYMSPEECAGGSIDQRSDVYRLGVIFYEMLTGRPPFDAPTAVAIARQHIEQTPSLNAFHGATVQPLASLLRRALEKNPAARPSAVDFARTLRHLEYLTEKMPRLEDVARPPAASTVAISENESVPSSSASSSSSGTSEAAPLPQDASATKPSTVDDTIGEIKMKDTGADVATNDNFDEITGETPAPRRLPSGQFSRSNAAEGHAVKSSPIGDASSAHFRSSFSPREHHHSTAPPAAPIVVPVDSASGSRSGQPRFTMLMVALVAAVALLLFSALWLKSRNTASQSSQTQASVEAIKADAPAAAEQTGTTANVLVPNSEATSNAANQNGNSALAPMVFSRGSGSRRRAAANASAEASALYDNFDAWVAATNGSDLDRQMSFYASRLNSYYGTRNLSSKAVRGRKLRSARTASSANVQVSEPEITFSPDGRRATMRFRKSYIIVSRRGTQRREVIQELHWLKTEKGWKIISEQDVETAR